MVVAERERVATLRLPALHAAQARIKREKRRMNVLCAGRRWGKNILGMDALLEPALRGLPVAWFAPNYKLLIEVWREVKLIVEPITAHTDSQQKRLELTTGGVIEFWSLDTQAVARGRRYARVVIDEAAQAPELESQWQEIILPTLTDFKGDAWFLSTPKGFNFFHKLFERGRDPMRPIYRSWQMPSWTNPLLDPAEIETQRNELPESVFNQEFGASFLDDSEAIMDRSWWASPERRYDPTDPSMARRCIGRWISWDTALKDTNDAAYSACTVGELMPDYRLVIREVWRARLPFPDLPQTIERFARQYNQDHKLRGVLIEDRASGISALQTLRASAEPWLADLLIAFSPVGSKEVRANQAAVWARLGAILHPLPCDAVPWAPDFEQELYAFPNSEFADQMDSWTQLILYLENFLSDGVHARGIPRVA